MSELIPTGGNKCRKIPVVQQSYPKSGMQQCTAFLIEVGSGDGTCCHAGMSCQFAIDPQAQFAMKLFPEADRLLLLRKGKGSKTVSN